MPDRGILVLDVGLSAVKAYLFTFDGKVLAEARKPLMTRSPRPGWYVQDPEDWWRMAVDAARQVLVAAAARTVAGIGVTGHMHAPVLVDSAGSPVIECPVVWDRRPEAEWSELGAAFDIRRHHAQTGGRVGPQAVPPKLRWFAKHVPDILRRAHVLLAPKDFLRLRLTGETGTDPTDAAGLLLLDIHRGTWVSDLAEAAGISPAILPPIMPSASVTAGVTREAAHALGLPIGTPVIMGAGDDVEALGLGAVHAGDVYEHLGSTGTFGVVTDRLVIDPQARVETVPHAYDGRWIVGGSTNAACAGLDEVRRLMGDYTSNGQGYETVAFPSGSPARRPLFLPYLAGERTPLWDDALRGAFVGLELTTNRQELLASVMEGIAFSLRDISEVLGELGLTRRRVYASGGGAVINGWAQLRASIYGLPIMTSRQPDATGRGIFFLIAIALGVFKTLDEAQQALPVQCDVSEPDGMAPAYETRYRAFRTLVETLAPWFRTSAHTLQGEGR
jgi:xylulokinase